MSRVAEHAVPSAVSQAASKQSQQAPPPAGFAGSGLGAMHSGLGGSQASVGPGIAGDTGLANGIHSGGVGRSGFHNADTQAAYDAAYQVHSSPAPRLIELRAPSV